MRRTGPISKVSRVGLLSLLGIPGLCEKPDPIVGTWRPVQSTCLSTIAPKGVDCTHNDFWMTFHSDGTFVYSYHGGARADAGPEEVKVAEAMKVASEVPGTFKRGSDTLVTTSFPRKQREAFLAAGGPPSDAPKDQAETSDSIVNYRLDGDILETTWHSRDAEATTVDKYVRAAR